MIHAGTASTPTLASRLLATSPFTYIGRISYAWYLWHWPVFFFGWLLFPGHGVLAALAMSALSLTIAALTYVAVEQPVRFQPRLVKSSLLSLGLGIVLVGVGIASARLLIAHGDGLSVRLSNGETILVEEIVKDRSTAYRIDCHASVQEVTHRTCRFGKEGAKADVVLLGDSHAAQFFDPLAAAAENLGTGLLMRSKSGCPAILAGLWSAKFKRPYEECDTWREMVLATVAAERPKLVILSSATAYDLIDPQTGAVMAKDQSAALYREGLRRLIARILESAEKVVLIKDTPRFPEEPVNCLYRNPGNEQICSWPVEAVTTGETYVPDLSEFGARATLVDLNSLICAEGQCRAIAQGRPVLYDTSHLARSFAMGMIAEFENLLRRSGI